MRVPPVREAAPEGRSEGGILCQFSWRSSLQNLSDTTGCIKHRRRYVHCVKQRIALLSALLLGTVFLLSACASSGDSMSGDSVSDSAPSGTPIPGEKMSDEGKFTPGGPGASGTVHW
jgi:hypothetical protein